MLLEYVNHMLIANCKRFGHSVSRSVMLKSTRASHFNSFNRKAISLFANGLSMSIYNGSFNVNFNLNFKGDSTDSYITYRSYIGLTHVTQSETFKKELSKELSKKFSISSREISLSLSGSNQMAIGI